MFLTFYRGVRDTHGKPYFMRSRGWYNTTSVEPLADAFAVAQRDAWIAQDGGFLVKYVGTATGKNTVLSSKMAEGTFTWEYNVQDANQVEAIELPKECAGQKPADDIPMPPNDR